MKLPVAAAALLFAASAAMPAFAATRANDNALHVYRSGHHANAAAPRFENRWAAWGHCARGEQSATSAYPSWDVCSRR